MKKTLARTLLCAAIAVAGCSKKNADHGGSDSVRVDPGSAADKRGIANDDRAEEPTPTTDKEGGDSFTDYGVNPTTTTQQDRLSTFAIDVDTASYTIARRMLRSGTLPPAAAVRVEEFVNYFGYGYAYPTDDSPFAVHIDGAPSPFDSNRHIVRVGLQAKNVDENARKRANLVFLVDISGSMGSPDKIGMAKYALGTLVNSLRGDDNVSIVTYAGGTEVVLESTSVKDRPTILAGIERLSTGGGTAMGDGLELAYAEAAKQLGPDSISRVIVISDGDANIGATSFSQILERLDGYVKEGVTLSTIGVGMGNYKDTMMEQLANRGNGNYYYVDEREQAVRLLRDQLTSMLQVVAKDVKIQVEFLPEVVKSYRLVGYENRNIADEDFRNDRVDAGEIGANHSVTALYEVELTGAPGALARVRLRAKQPRGSEATETEVSLERSQLSESFAAANRDLRFATAVMAAAEILRGSNRADDWSLATVRDIASKAAADLDDRKEFIELLDKAISLDEKLARQ